MSLHRFLIGAALWILPAAALAASFDRDLYFGIARDPDVTRLQEFLRDEGVYDGPVTGNFLTLTREGVKNFQRREGIEPIAGYFGPFTRAKTNDLLSQKIAGGITLPAGSRAEKIAFIEQKIAELTKQLEELRIKLVEEERVKATTTVDTMPPVLIQAPYVKTKGFISERPFGAPFPYRVILDWTVGEISVSESVACSPAISKTRRVKNATEYFPAPNTSYSCTVTVADTAGNKASGTALFTSPPWVSAAELWTAPSFSATEEDPFKIGEFAVYNGTTTSVLFANIETIIYDDMDSYANRNREVIFLLRDGKNATDTLISKKKFTFSINPPNGNPHKTSFTMIFDVLLSSGEEKTASLWVEKFRSVRNGTLKITFVKIEAVGHSVEGEIDFVLTKEPSL